MQAPRRPSRSQAAALGWVVAAAGAYALGTLGLPRGLPPEAVVPGLIYGGLSALTAVGLVLIYRATRVINFAQANMGAVSATLTILLIDSWHWSYWIALPVGLLISLLLGQQVELAFIRPFAKAPRLIVTVATIGVAQLMAGLAVILPQQFNGSLSPGSLLPITSPLNISFEAGTYLVSGDAILAIVAVPLVLVGLFWYFNRTDSGVATRGAADSQERALLLGIPVQRLSVLTWMLASLLSATAAILTAGVSGYQSTLLGGPESLLLPLTAAVVARFDSLLVALVASVALGIFQQAIFWSYPRSSVVDVALFLIILAALLGRRQAAKRVGGEDLGGFVALSEPRPLPSAIAELPEVRWARYAGLGLILIGVGVVPLFVSNSALAFSSFVAIFVIVATSLVVLTGWGGQVSLGQFAFVGLGAGITAWLLTSYHASLLLCLVASAAAGLVAAVAIGVPSLRIPGLYLAAVTLAFGVPASTYLLSSQHFPSLAPSRVDPPILFGRYDLSEPRDFYYVCLVVALVSLGLARNFRSSRAGRNAIGVRDNERMTAAVSISPLRARLVTFAFSGALAGAAGCLYVLAYRGIPQNGFSPILSLQAFTMVIVGGMGSLWGGVLGALYVYGAQYYLGSWAQLVVTGGGIITILRFAPGGLADLGYRARNQLVLLLLARRGLSANLLFERSEAIARPPLADRAKAYLRRQAAANRPKRRSRAVAPRTVVAGTPLLQCERVTAGYGHLRILFGVDVEVLDGEVFALLGTNGAGKSTILKVIAGILPSDGGRLLLAGEDITGLSPAERVERGIVLVPGGRGVFGSLTVAENLRAGGWTRRRKGDKEFLDSTLGWIFELFPILRSRADQRASLLSGGEQQMLTIAQALLCKPRILMIDELSLGLAPVVVGELLGVLRTLNASGITVVLVEQSMNIAVNAAPRAVFLEKGEVRFTGRTVDLADSANLVRSVFLSDVQRRTRPLLSATERRAPTEADAPTVALEVRGITKTYGGVTAVDDVDLSLPTGQIVGVIGANGAGKTTLFDIITGTISPDAGQIVMNGRNLTGRSAAGRAALGLGRTFQDLRLIPSMTVADLLALAHERRHPLKDPVSGILGVGVSLRAEATIAREVSALLESFNLGRYKNSFISELSTGTRRVVELACASAHEPSVLILDEPSSGLAQREAEAMTQILLDIKERTGATLAIIEHDIPMIRTLSDQVVCMHLGAVIAQGLPDDVLAQPAVVASYLGVDEVAVERSGRAASVKRPGRSRTSARVKAVVSEQPT
jgi:ABC-type branched-subunit amino acid transport system ATPase component/branched-subunit amino acid ABC-type transport system permease component